MSVKLLPCPFCGGEAEIEQVGDSRRSTTYACTDCSCILETCEEWDHGRRWNQRVSNPEGLMEVIELANTWRRLANMAQDTVEGLLKQQRTLLVVTDGVKEEALDVIDDLIGCWSESEGGSLSAAIQIAEIVKAALKKKWEMVDANVGSEDAQ